MLIDQLFENENKKQLDEVDPRNFDSDEDYYAAVRRGKRSSYDDVDDYEPEDEIDDMDSDEESYYEKSLRTRGLGEQIKHMLENVQTKEDVQKIKQYIDRQFTKHGLVSESAFKVRNSLIEQVTQIGAQRRREFARKS